MVIRDFPLSAKQAGLITQVYRVAKKINDQTWRGKKRREYFGSESIWQRRLDSA